MTQKSLAALLKGLIIAVGLFGTAVLVYVSYVLFTYVQAIALYLVSFLAICILPCYAVLILSWGVARNIGRDRSFSFSNAKLLKYNAILSACDTLLFALGTLIILFSGYLLVTIFGVAIIILFFGVAATIVFASLSHLVYKAAELQEENNLTV